MISATRSRVPLRLRAPDRRLVLIVLLGALVIRLLLVAVTVHKYVPVHDSQDFSRIATSLSAGHGFGASMLGGVHGPSAFRTPLFPAVISVVYAVTGVSWTAARLVMAVISTAFVGSVGLLAWKVGGRRLGYLALVLAAIYPPLILASYGLNYEVLMGSLLCCSLTAALQWKETGRWTWLVLAGALVGLAVLCRENGALLLVPIWLVILKQRWQIHWRGVAGRALVVTTCAVAVVLPWTIRNALVVHAFLPVSDSPGLALACEYNATSQRYAGSDIACYIPTADPADLAKLRSIVPTTSEPDYESTLQNVAKQYIVHHPSYVPEAVGWNAVRLFDLRGPTDSLYLASVTPWPARLLELSIVAFYGMAIVLIAGLFFARRELVRLPSLLWSFPVLWCLSLVITVADIQYRLVAEPFLIIAVAAVLLGFRDRMKRPGGAQPGTTEGHSAVSLGDGAVPDSHPSRRST